MGELTPLQLKATWRLWGADTELFENKRYAEQSVQTESSREMCLPPSLILACGLM